jgi:hypothetical protein
MKRKTLDLIFSIGGGLLAILLLVLGLVLQNQASFADSYVRDQLAQQKITFTPEEGLSDQEREADCLVANAGEPLLTGKQAECYANEYIGLHLTFINEGKTYSETSGQARAKESELEEARAADPESAEVAQLEQELAELQGKTESVFRGEALRGVLLTAYGFSVFGERAGQAALVAFLVAGVLGAASIAGFVHAFSKAGEQRIE